MFVPSILAQAYAIFHVYAWRTTCSRSQTRGGSHRSSFFLYFDVMPHLGTGNGVETAEVEECGSNKRTNKQTRRSCTV